MAKKKAKSRKAPRVQKWLEMGCEGVTADGRMKKGYRPPASKGQCPRPGKGVKGRKAAKARGCTALIRKGAAVSYKRGFQACWKEVPKDVRNSIVGKVLAHEKTPHTRCVDWDEHEGRCNDKPAWTVGISKKAQARIRGAQRRAGSRRAIREEGDIMFLGGHRKGKRRKKKGFFAKLFR